MHEAYWPADAGLHCMQHSLVSGQDCLVHRRLVFAEPAIGWEGAGDVAVVAVVFAAHVQQQHIVAANLSVCRALQTPGEKQLAEALPRSGGIALRAGNEAVLMFCVNNNG